MKLSVQPFLQGRIERLRKQLGEGSGLIAAGMPASRNFPANLYPFRASSHFLYLVGASIAGALMHLTPDGAKLYVPRPTDSHRLWHGEGEDLAVISESIGTEVGYVDQLPNIALAMTIPCMDHETNARLTTLLGRPIQKGVFHSLDEPLMTAMVNVRLRHDDLAIQEIRSAAEATVEAHGLAQRSIRPGVSCHEVWALMQAEFVRRGMGAAYNPIITPAGEVLHCDSLNATLEKGDLVLLDVGAETPTGWAADVTRTWSVGAMPSDQQRSIHAIVSKAHEDAVSMVAPGVEYRDIHLRACLTLTQGLVEVGILMGDPEDLVDRDAHALFFPHGIGHLLGLDVHDMEDLGDHAGYEKGRSRSDRFGLGYLRLDRPLAAGMVVTIEPGFYQVPTLLTKSALSRAVRDCVDWTRLAHFADVRGIRIEDDILVTDSGYENLTNGIQREINI